MPSNRRLFPAEIPIFSVIPFIDDYPLEDPFGDDYPLEDPFPESRRALSSPFLGALDRVKRELRILQEELGMIGGIRRRRDVFQVDLDVRGYKPEDLNICVENDTLTICGLHKETTADGKHFQSRHFTRRFTLPDNVEKDKITSCIQTNGLFACLQVEAPLKNEQ